MSNITKKNSYPYYSVTPVVTPKKTTKQVSRIDAIFRTIKKAGAKGLTCAQVEARLKFSHGTTSGRIADLEKYGKIVINGTRRTKNGRDAFVWVTNAGV